MACVCFYSGHTVCVMYEQVEVLSVAFEPDDDVHMRGCDEAPGWCT